MSEAARATRGGRHLAAALMLIGTVACGKSDNTIGPEVPGSISITTETSGFQQDDSYELLVGGTSAGTIGANDEVMITELDPATYELALGDVADNCVVENASATVTSAETATATLTITCAPGEATPYSLRASRDRLNLDDGTIVVCSFGICPSGSVWHFYVEFNSTGSPRAVIRQNGTDAVEIAHLPGKSLDNVTEADVDGATFTLDPVDDPFDSGRLVLIRTAAGDIHALANPVENTTLLTLAFDAVQLVAAP